MRFVDRPQIAPDIWEAAAYPKMLSSVQKTVQKTQYCRSKEIDVDDPIVLIDYTVFFYFAKLFLRNMILKTVVSLPGRLGILMSRSSLSEQVEGGMGEPSRKRSHGRKGFLCGLWGFSGLLPVGCLWHLPNAGDAPVGCLPCGGSRGTCEQSPPSSQNEARQSPPASARPSAVTEGDVRWAWLDLGDSPPWHC